MSYRYKKTHLVLIIKQVNKSYKISLKHLFQDIVSQKVNIYP